MCILPSAVLYSADCWDSDTTVNQVLLTLAESQCHLDLENMQKWSKNLDADEITESAFMKKRLCVLEFNKITTDPSWKGAKFCSYVNKQH